MSKKIKNITELKGKLWSEFNKSKDYYTVAGADYIIAMGETAKSIASIEKLERESRKLKRAKKGQSLKALKGYLWKATDKAQSQFFSRTARAQALGSLTQAIMAVESEESTRRKIYRSKLKQRNIKGLGNG